MSKFMRTLLAVLGIGALMLTLVVMKPAATSAANLTGGNYTYLVDGEEVTFTFDPVVRATGLLLPPEVFQQFDITVDGATGRTITVSKDGVVAKLNLGLTQYDLSGASKVVNTAPLRLNGRVFLPADLLKEFGVEFIQDGTIISMRKYVDEMPTAQTVPDTTWTSFKSTRGFSSNLKSDAGVYMWSDVMLLDDFMISATNFNISYGTRARLYSMLQTNTLLLVHLSNQVGTRSGGLIASGLYLVDDQRNEYDLQSVIDIGQGLLTSKLVPGADRWGVLVYPKLPGGLKTVSAYYDNNTAIVGTFPVTQ